MAIRVSGALLVASAALVFAVIESFLVPFSAGDGQYAVYVPVSAILAVIANAGLTVLVVWLTGWRASVLIPGGVWFVVVVGLSRPTGDGDLVIPDIWPGYVMLVGGAVSAIITAYLAATRRR